MKIKIPPIIILVLICFSLNKKYANKLINKGYDISISPANVAFLILIEFPIHNSARMYVLIPARTRSNNFFDEAMVIISDLNEPEKKEIKSIIRKVEKDEIVNNVITEILLNIFSSII